MSNGFYRLIPVRKCNLDFLDFLKDGADVSRYDSPFKKGSWQNKAWDQVAYDIRWNMPSGYRDLDRSLDGLKRVAVQAKVAVKDFKKKGRVRGAFGDDLKQTHGLYRIADTNESLENLLTELYQFIRREWNRYCNSTTQGGKFQIRIKCLLIYDDGSAEAISGEPAKIFGRFNVDMKRNRIVLPVEQYE